MDALRKARTVWAKTAQRSKEAAHATMVLERLLSKVFDVDKSTPSETHGAPINNGKERLHNLANEAAASAPSESNVQSTAHEVQSEASRPQPGWSAVNSSAPPQNAPSRSYSIEWDYWWLDEPYERIAKPLNDSWDDWVSVQHSHPLRDALPPGRSQTPLFTCRPLLSNKHSHRIALTPFC